MDRLCRLRLKRGILRTIRVAWHERSRIRNVTYSDLGDMEPDERLLRLAQGTRQQWESGSEVTTIYTNAATVDPEAAAELKQTLGSRRKGMQNFASGMVLYLQPALTLTGPPSPLRRFACLRYTTCSSRARDDPQRRTTKGCF